MASSILIKICAFCRNEFTPKRSNSKFCNRNCYYGANSANKLELKCSVCQTQFKISKYRKGNAKFCSLRCHFNSRIHVFTKECLVCKTPFILKEKGKKKDKTKYCSPRCFLLSRPETLIEQKVREILECNNFIFEKEFPVKKYHFDFYICELNLLIECDGNYWHSFPKAIKKDVQKQKLAEKLGYKVIRFSETEINQKDFELQLIGALHNYANHKTSALRAAETG